jgi:hypothetical protein
MSFVDLFGSSHAGYPSNTAAHVAAARQLHHHGRAYQSISGASQLFPLLLSRGGLE